MSSFDHFSVLVGTAVLLLALVAVVSGQYDDQPDIRDNNRDSSSSSSNNSEIPPGISRLLLKNMRFRDVEGMEGPDVKANQGALNTRFDWGPGVQRKASALGSLQTFLRMARNPKLKRERNRHLMNNLAEMLSGNTER